MKKFRFEAVMDKVTCPRCSFLHNKILSEDQLKAGLMPPLHRYNKETKTADCRCVLIELKEATV